VQFEATYYVIGPCCCLYGRTISLHVLCLYAQQRQYAAPLSNTTMA